MKFSDVVTEAVRDMSDNGFSPERIAFWQEKLRQAAASAMGSKSRIDAMLKDSLSEVYRRLIENGHALKVHPGVSRFTVEKLKPRLRVELQKRIYASADLIKLHRETAITETLQRFSGWATSIPADGSDVVDKLKVKANIKKPLAQLPFEQRRVIIDQGHKFAASINEVIGLDNGAIASIWYHHYSQHPRHYHEDRDGVLFLIRDSWAVQRGFVKLAGHQYRDQVERVGELPFCRCTESWVYNLRDLPPDMLTVAGREELDRVRREIRARRAA